MHDTALNRWLHWFGSHSPTWLEALISPAGIHNFLTHHVFSPLERLFLSNGLRFIPTPSTSRSSVFAKQYTDDAERGLPRFIRFLLNQLAHQSTEAAITTQPYLSKFKITSTHTLDSAWRRSQLRNASPNDLFIVEDYEALTKSLLTKTLLRESQPITTAISKRRNITKDEQLFLQRLMGDQSITIKPADKNLGMVMVDTSWYNNELSTMLKDKITYRRYEYRSGKQMRSQYSIVDALHSLVTILVPQLESIAKRHSSTLEAWHPLLSSQMLHYLTSGVSKKNAAIPSIYLLIKVHKPKGLCGRPIVPSTHWITTPASKLADHLLQQILHDAHIPWIVKDTKSLVRELESTPMLNKCGVFVTADIASLYTNIDTDLGLRLVEEFLLLQQVPAERRLMIMDLLRFVMKNSYLTFMDLVLHQIDGTAMGTSVAPTYANIVVYMLERKVIAEFGSSIYYYRRFLDDIFVYLGPSVADRFKVSMNALHPKLHFDFVDSISEAAFLDLSISRGQRFMREGLFDLRVHQKKMNLYLYIPYCSFHTDAAKRSFIQTELMRYIRNSSDQESYVSLKALFWSRLRDRGYPRSFLVPIFASIFYADRHLFLVPSSELLNHVLITNCRPRSSCLLRKLEHMYELRRQGIASKKDAPPVFVIPYSPLSAVVPTRSILTRHWEYLCTALPLPRPIIAYQSLPNLVKQLVYTKAKNEADRRAATSRVQHTSQPSVASFFTRRLPAPPRCSIELIDT
jgi:hypothetical protein